MLKTNSGSTNFILPSIVYSPDSHAASIDDKGYGGGKRYYITSAISYPNGAPHIGHAYEAIACDVIARFYRLDGWNVHFLTGTDEHGLKMAQTASKMNVSPQELADKNSNLFIEMDKRLNVNYNDFIRTTEPRHHKGSQHLWQLMHEAGDMYLDSYSGWYSVRDEAYYSEDELSLNDAGEKLSPHGTPVSWVDEETWFFRLSKYQDKLLDLYNKNPEFVRPKERLNEVRSFVEGGLNDLSVSRTTFDWGIKVPNSPNHVMYVWVDALANYLTAVGFGNESEFLKNARWPANLHIIGKDIVRFHAVYWPAFLMSANIALPDRVFAHGFLFNKGEKMSKSVGNVIDPINLADKFSVDGLRYFLLRDVPFGRDGSYSAEAIANRINSDLANDFGNLAQRVLSMINKNCGGCVPQHGELTEDDEKLLQLIKDSVAKVRADMQQQALHSALISIWHCIGEANRYIANQMPWSVRKQDPQRADTILYVGAEALRCFAILAQPFVPQAAEKLLDILSVAHDDRFISNIGSEFATPLSSGALIKKPEVLFPKIQLEE